MCARHFPVRYNFLFLGEQRRCDGRGGGAQRPVSRVNEPKTTGARSARARTHCRNLQVVSEKMFFKIWTTINLVSYFGCFVKIIFSAGFRSVPSFGTGSSAEVGMPRNDHFLPRNNGSRSESIPRNFFGTKFRSQPYIHSANSVIIAKESRKASSSLLTLFRASSYLLT